MESSWIHDSFPMVLDAEVSVTRIQSFSFALNGAGWQSLPYWWKGCYNPE